MSKTVVGLFNSTSEAQQVKQTLISQGYQASNIRVVAQDSDDDYSSGATYQGSAGTGSSTMGGTGTGIGADTDYERRSGTGIGSGLGTGVTTGAVTGSGSGYGTGTGTGTGTGIGEKISSFFHSLTGGDQDAHQHYATGVNEGGALLTVTTSDDQAEQVASLLKQHGARDIHGQSGAGSNMGSYGTGAAATRTGENLTGETTIPVVEEQLVVGKREVDRGGVRIYSHVVERPAEADVMLRDERVNVERRTVNRPATAADFEVGNGQSIEVRATGEEAVVGKSSRVVEEVLVGKEATERNEAIHDSVRRTEVEVEQIPGQQLTDKTRLYLAARTKHAGRTFRCPARSS